MGTRLRIHWWFLKLLGQIQSFGEMNVLSIKFRR